MHQSVTKKLLCSRRFPSKNSPFIKLINEKNSNIIQFLQDCTCQAKKKKVILITTKYCACHTKLMSGFFLFRYEKSFLLPSRLSDGWCACKWTSEVGGKSSNFFGHFELVTHAPCIALWVECKDWVFSTLLLSSSIHLWELVSTAHMYGFWSIAVVLSAKNKMKG